MSGGPMVGIVKDTTAKGRQGERYDELLLKWAAQNPEHPGDEYSAYMKNPLHALLERGGEYHVGQQLDAKDIEAVQGGDR